MQKKMIGRRPFCRRRISICIGREEPARVLKIFSAKLRRDLHGDGFKRDVVPNDPSFPSLDKFSGIASEKKNGRSFACRSLLLFREILFPRAAKRTNPIFGQVVEGSSGIDSVVGVSFFRVVHITAYVANILFHDSFFKVRYPLSGQTGGHGANTVPFRSVRGVNIRI